MDGHVSVRSSSELLALQRPLRWGAAGVSSPERAFTLPTGTVTFLLTDIEGSTRLWQSEPAELMRTAVLRHYELLADMVVRHHGVRPQEQGEGDSVVAAFARPSDAVRCALDAQRALRAEPWATSVPLRVRMAVHTGEAQMRDDANYAGQAIIRTARLRSLGHGGQVLVSGATHDLAFDQVGAEIGMRSLGEHRLRDLGRVEHVWQLVHAELPDEFPPLAEAGPRDHNLPTPVSPFIGRINEVATLSGLVLRERVVTATGSGGAGKTRLAVAVGGEVADSFGGGLWWVELAHLSADEVGAALRPVLGIGDAVTLPIEEVLRRMLDGKPGLVIFDNVEHVVDAVRPLVDRLVATCPTLHVLATSRVMLDVPGELAWRVPPLALPDRSTSHAPDALGQYDAVRLFCDRARRARPNFALRDDNGATIAELCHRLDGIPLAIELAAARCRLLAPAQILAGLDDAFRMLAGGSRTLMPRQQTLEASIAWSHDLLSPIERLVFRRLAVFVDGWTLDAAEAVCRDENVDVLSIFDALDRLVDHSLVNVYETPTGSRFQFLETVRQFAKRCLEVVGDEQRATERRHAHWYGAWITSLAPSSVTREILDVLPALDADQANVDLAYRHLLDAGEFESAIAMLPVINQHQIIRNHPARLLRMADDACGRPELHGTREYALACYMRFAGCAGTGLVHEAIAAAAESSAAATAIGDRRLAADARSQELTVQGAMGLDVLTELDECADSLRATGDDAASDRCRSMAVSIAAAKGDLVDARARASRITADPGRTIFAAVEPSLDLGRGLIALRSGQPRAAVEFLTRALTSPFLLPGVVPAAAVYLGLANTDLGLAASTLPGPDLARADVLGMRMASMAVACLRAMDAAMADDLALAESETHRVTDLAGGLQSTFPQALEMRYVLAAAGRPASAEDPRESRFLSAGAREARSRAEVALQRGDLANALGEVHDALRREAEQEADRGVLMTLELLARAEVARGHHREAARLLGCCDAQRSTREMVRVPVLARLLDGARAEIEAALGDVAASASFAEGTTLDVRGAVAYAQRLRGATTVAVTGWDALTPTETRVAELVAAGHTNPQVAKALIMSPETVKTHVSRVFTKLGVSNRKDLILAASRRTPPA